MVAVTAPKDDGTYVVEFRTAEGECLAISIPRTETAVVRHFGISGAHALRVVRAGGANRIAKAVHVP
jgi:hypothetical protein